MAKEEKKDTGFMALEAKSGEDIWGLSFDSIVGRYNLKKNNSLILSTMNLTECHKRAKENNIEFK